MLLHHSAGECWADVNHVSGTDANLYVRCISFSYTDTEAEEARLDRERYFLQFVAEGRVLHDGVEYGEGEVYLMEPNRVHRLRCISDGPLMQYCIEFHGALAPILCKEAGLTGLSRHTFYDTEKMKRIFHDAVYETGNISESALVKMSLGLLYFAISQLDVGENADKVTQSGYVERAAQFMRDNYMYGIKASDAATSVGLTEKYLCRLFGRELGITPVEYLCRCRLERAMELLSSKELSVAEISRMVGIEDPTYFSRFIRTRTGKSPSQLR